MKFVLAILLMLALIASVSATDYSATEEMTEQLLTENTPGVYQPDVSISESSVDITYKSLSATTGNVVKDIGSIVGAYCGMVSLLPEIGDMYCTINDFSGDKIGSFYCYKSWADGIDINSQDEIGDVCLKAIGTLTTES